MTQFYTASPSEILARYVKRYWAMDHAGHAGDETAQRIVPSGLTELVFYFGTPPGISGGHHHFEDSVLLSGQQTDPYDLNVSGALSLFSVYFRPEGVRAFFDIPCDELADRHFPLRFLLKNETGELEGRLYDAATFRERVDLIESFLIGRLKRMDNHYVLKRLSQSVSLIGEYNGQVGVDRLAAEACLSRKQYERSFMHHLGISPKQFSRTVRFQYALAQKGMHPTMSLTSLAHDCGYYDQSHMIREFRALSGFTPSEFFSEGVPYSDFYQ